MHISSPYRRRFAAFLLSLAAAGAAAQQPAAVLDQAAEGGIDLSRPVAVSFDWRRSEPAPRAAEVTQRLLRAGFVLDVSASVSEEPGTSTRTIVVSARRTGIFRRHDLVSLIAQIEPLVRGIGSTSWSISQSHP